MARSVQPSADSEGQPSGGHGWDVGSLPLQVAMPTAKVLISLHASI